MQSFEQIQSAAEVAGPELSAFLGVSINSILSELPFAMEAIPFQAMQIIESASYELGVDLDAIPRLSAAPSFVGLEAEGFDNCANHVATMPPIRNQEKRGTCVSFAALAAVEHWMSDAGAYQDISEQFLYWNCKTNDGSPNSAGTWLGVAYPLLQRDGCCLEVDWTYQPLPIPNNEGQAPPPPGTQAKALGFRIPSVRTISPTSVADIRTTLKQNRVVSFSVPVFNSWYRSNAVIYSGEITMPIPAELRAGGHAMCIVGCIDLPGEPAIGGGRFIIRNSWGANWGINSPHGAGYGTIPYAYIANFGVEAYAVG